MVTPSSVARDNHCPSMIRQRAGLLIAALLAFLLADIASVVVMLFWL